MGRRIQRFILMAMAVTFAACALPPAAMGATRAPQRKSPGIADSRKNPPRPPHPNMLLKRGWRAYHRGELGKAVALFEYGAQLYPNDPSLHYDLGCLYAVQKKFSLARKALRAALLLNPRFASAYDALGQAYEQEYYFDEALLFYGVATELEPDNVRFLTHLARVQMRISEFKGARESLRQILLFDPQDTESRYLLGTLQIRAGEYEQAAEQFRRVVEGQPSHVMAWNGLGLACTRLKRFPEAAQALKRAEALEPDNPVTQNHLGLLAAEQQLWDQARSAWESALRMSPGFAPADKNLKEILTIHKESSQ